MIFTSLLIPIWKTRDYSFAVDSMKGNYLIYLRRLEYFYMKNEAGVKLKFKGKDSDENEYFLKCYQSKTPISLDLVSITKK